MAVTVAEPVSVTVSVSRSVTVSVPFYSSRDPVSRSYRFPSASSARSARDLPTPIRFSKAAAATQFANSLPLSLPFKRVKLNHFAGRQNDLLAKKRRLLAL